MVTRLETETSNTEVAEQPRIDLNQADASALTALPGVGPVLAQRIVAYRDENGPFLFESDIQQVSGIGPSLYDDIENRLTLTLLPNAEDGADDVESDIEEPGNGKAAEFDAARVRAIDVEDEHPELPPPTEPAPLVTPPPLPASVSAEDATAEDDQLQEEEDSDHEASPTPTDEAAREEELDLEAEAEIEEPTQPEPTVEAGQGPEAAPERQATAEGRRSGWLWPVVLGALLGAMLGVGLMLIIFASVNGSIDINRSRAMTQMRGQMNEMGVELDAIQGDVSALQGDVSGLRERVQVLSGLTARMEQAEEALATFSVEIQALEEETANLTTSLDTLSEDVDSMGETLDAVTEQTERATSFFEGLQELMQEIFGQPMAPQSAAPGAVEGVDV